MSDLSGIKYPDQTQLVSYSVLHKILAALSDVFANVYTFNPSQNFQPETVLPFLRPTLGEMNSLLTLHQILYRASFPSDLRTEIYT